MFDSFFESAKETIRRAGALDGSSKMKDDGVKAGVASVPADPDRDSAIKGDRFTPPTESEVGARERNVDSTSTAMTSSAASAAASSLSRSFSRLKASGATSVSKVKVPETNSFAKKEAPCNLQHHQEPLHFNEFITKSFRLADKTN